MQFHVRIAKKVKNTVLPSQNSALTRIERGVGGPGAQLNKTTNTLFSLV